MNNLQILILFLWMIFSFSAFLFGIKNRKNPFGLTPFYGPIGAFVWVDAIVFGLFFSLVSLVCLYLQDFVLFLLVISLFWTIRLIGEQVYWFLEQFALKHRNPPRTLWPVRYFSFLFKGEETWIVMQIVLQCMSVVSIILTVYLFSIWIK